MTSTLYYCDHHEIPLPEGHRFPVRKYRLLRELLMGDGQFSFVAAPFAPVETLKLAHDSEYVDQFLAGALPAQVQRRIGFPWSEQLVSRTLASVGGTLAAAARAIAFGFGGNLAGGTHHAFRNQGAGFCVFNDIAVAVHWLRKQHGLHRAAVIDLDVHQGDGTALIFEHDPNVLTLSVHGRKNFLFRKQRSKIDVELEDAVADEEYLAAVENVLPRVFEFVPKVIFYQSGVDPLDCDLLGRLAVTTDGLRHRDRLVLQACRAAHVPVVVTLGGGYGDPIERTAEAHANTLRIAHKLYAEGSQQLR
ncbi:MAG TPA: histone deacetylase [Clostridia bacterium]|nr:histone deacetylase [Clostridia bacterium]